MKKDFAITRNVQEFMRGMDVVATPVKGRTCTVGKKGIQIDHRHYISEELASRDLAGREVRVERDPTDFGTIYVFAESGKFLCTAAV